MVDGISDQVDHRHFDRGGLDDEDCLLLARFEIEIVTGIHCNRREIGGDVFNQHIQIHLLRAQFDHADGLHLQELMGDARQTVDIVAQLMADFGFGQQIGPRPGDCDRCPQLMCGIGKKAIVPVIPFIQLREGMVERIDQRDDLGRHLRAIETG